MTEISTDLKDKDKLENTIYWSERNGSCAVESRDTLIVLYEKPDDADVGPEDTILYFKPYDYLWAKPANAGQGTWTHFSGTAQMDEADRHNPKVFVSFVW